MPQIISPKTITDIKYPLIFLAGPIRSAPEWQDEAIEILIAQNQDISIANPRRTLSERFMKFKASGDENYFQRQRAWEWYYQDYASQNGAIMFWLPEEKEHKCEKVYGAMTRVELGQWMTNYKFNNMIRLCIGSDGKFSELSTILYDLSLITPGIRVKESLKETCLEALSLACGK